jgi:hypothetical protein
MPKCSHDGSPGFDTLVCTLYDWCRVVHRCAAFIFSVTKLCSGTEVIIGRKCTVTGCKNMYHLGTLCNPPLQF